MNVFREFKINEHLITRLINASSYKEQEQTLFQIIKTVINDYIFYKKEIDINESFRETAVSSLEFIEVGDIIEKNFGFSYDDFPCDHRMTILNYIQLTLAEMTKKDIVKKAA